MRNSITALLLMISMATAAQTRQQWLDSLSVLNDSIRLFPRNTDLRLRKAAANIELEQWDYAVEEYGRVLQLEPNNLAALYYRAYANNSLRHYDLAKNDYETFLSIVPKHFEAQLGLAMVKRKLGRQLDTLDELNRLVQLFPDSALAYAARAGYETELKQYDVALFDWDEALRLQPLNPDFVVSKADILLTLRRNDEAWAVLSDAIQQGIPRSVLKPWIDRCK
ncbi:MAG: tetratricopeptide repeat protein [Prevotella sp.]|nr:tetratricopeptide repeat protein [Prevotella sp.]